MKSINLFLLIFLLSVSTVTPVLGQPSANEIVMRADEIRNPPGAFQFQVQIDEFHEGRKGDQLLVKIYSKPESSSSQYRTLVKMVAPKRDSGKLVLRNGNSLWFYDPAASRSVRISPQQRLLGQASNGDVMTTNFSKDYNVKQLGIESIRDANKAWRKSYQLEMRALNQTVSYPRIEYWVDSENFRPIKGRFYAESGRLLKTVYYRRFKSILGEQRPTEALIIDGVDMKRVTRMLFSHYKSKEIPESWFQRDHLPRFSE